MKDDNLVMRAVGHFLALRRVRDRLREYGPIEGAQRLHDYHLGAVVAFTREITR